MIGQLVAIIAMLIQPVTPPADFTRAVLAGCVEYVQPGEFIGCVAPQPDGESLYAGVLWGDPYKLSIAGPEYAPRVVVGP